jgi:zinc transporter 1/2/3
MQHLLFHGFVMFQNECVGELSYEATAPAISMAAAMITFILDFVGSRIAHRRYSGHALESPSLTDNGESGSIERKGLRDADHPAHHDSHGHNFDAALSAEQNHQVLLLEAGIIFHSIMIGVTLVSFDVCRWVYQLTNRELVQDRDGPHCLSSSSSIRCSRV